jgi:hypothetical protein
VRDIGFSILSGILPTDSASPIPAAGSLFEADSTSFVNLARVVGVISVHTARILTFIS